MKEKIIKANAFWVKAQDIDSVTITCGEVTNIQLSGMARFNPIHGVIEYIQEEHEYGYGDNKTTIYKSFLKSILHEFEFLSENQRIIILFKHCGSILLGGYDEIHGIDMPFIKRSLTISCIHHSQPLQVSLELYDQIEHQYHETKTL